MMSQEIHEFYKHYRSSAVALSVTAIGMSGTMGIHVVGQSPLVSWFKIGFLVLVVVCILSALLVQFFHFRGYQHMARYFFLLHQGLPVRRQHGSMVHEARELNAETSHRLARHLQEYNRFFDYVDVATSWCFRTLLLSLITFATIIAWLELSLTR